MVGLGDRLQASGFRLQASVFRLWALWALWLGGVVTLALVVSPAQAQPAAPSGGAEVTPPLFGFSIEDVSLEGLSADVPLLAGLSGRAHLRATIVTRGSDLFEVVRVTSRDVRLRGMPLGETTVLIERPLGGRVSTLTLDAQGPLARRVHAALELPLDIAPSRGQVAIRPGPIAGFIEVEGLDLAQVTSAFPLLALAGRVGVAVDIGGTTDQPSVEAQLFGETFTWRNEPVGILAARWIHQARSTSLDVRWGSAANPIAAAHMNLPLTFSLAPFGLKWDSRQPMAFWLTARRLTPDLIRPVWKAPPGAAFMVDVLVSGQGTMDELVVDGSIEGDLVGGDGQSEPVSGRLAIRPTNQSLRLALGQDTLALDVDIHAPLSAIGVDHERLASAPIAARARMNLPLSTIAPYLPADIADPEGRLKGRMVLNGTLGRPSLRGRVRTDRAALTIVGLNQRLHDIEMVATADGKRLTIDTFKARSGAGWCEGSGSATFALTPPGQEPADVWAGWRMKAEGQLDLHAFPLLHQALPRGAVDARLEAEVDATGPATTAILTVDEATVQLAPDRQRLPQPIPTNPGIRRIGWTGEAQRRATIFDGDGHLLATVVIKQPILVRGDGIDLALVGRMEVDREDDHAEVRGGFSTLPDGEITLFGQRFNVLTGWFTLAGGDLSERAAIDVRTASAAEAAAAGKPVRPVPLEPVVHLLAQGKAVDTHVRLEVQGPSRRPELILASSPPLPEYQILTLLITGRVDTIDGRNGEVRRQAAALVDRFHNPSLSDQLYDRLGVDKIGVEFGNSVSNPILTVGKQVSRRIYVESIYHHNAPPDENRTEGRVELRLSPWWTVDTVYGDAGAGRVGIFWGTWFGGPQAEAAPEEWGEAVEEDGEAEAGGVEPE